MEGENGYSLRNKDFIYNPVFIGRVCDYNAPGQEKTFS